MTLVPLRAPLRHRLTSAAAALAALLAATPTAHAQDAPPAHQQRVLTAPPSPRFEITDRVWPTRVGEADVCLWKDDKLAALSFTIDDNQRPDHEWWIEQGRANGWRFTWFVIAGLVEQSPAHYGTWADFAHLLELGHDVQSHSVTHLDPKRGYTDIRDEYAPSIASIEEHLPGHRVTALAYPGGPNMGDNDHALAAELFVAARGVKGLINPVNTTDYNNTHSVSTIPFESGNWADLRNLLDPKQPTYRGWYSSHYHGLNDKSKEMLLQVMAYLKANDADLWVGLFREAALYGQERDTAELNVSQEHDGRFVVTLTDQMDDALFKFPLDIKLRVPDDWAGATATQGDRVAALAIVQHDGGHYVLAPVVPDAGSATIVAAEAPDAEPARGAEAPDAPFLP